jgi:hypothetical protein
LGNVARGLGLPHRRLGLLARPRVEKGGGGGADHRDHGLARHGRVAHAHRRAERRPEDRRGDLVDLADTGLAVGVDGHPQRPAVHRGEVDGHRILAHGDIAEGAEGQRCERGENKGAGSKAHGVTPVSS